MHQGLRAALLLALPLVAACSGGGSAPAKTPAGTSAPASTAASSATSSTPTASATASSTATAAASASGTPASTPSAAAATATAPAPSSTSQAAPPAPGAGGSATTISAPIVNFTYPPVSGPAPLVVRWTNNDTVDHDVRFGSDTSPVMHPGGSYERRFDRPGTYAYLCSIHPFMTGSVVVR